jgi:hypothetical protein
MHRASGRTHTSPYWLTGGWEGADCPLVLKVVGAALLAAGLGFLAHTVIRFYAAIFWLVVARFYEEPTLSRRYGERYAAYRRAVRSWWPWLTPRDADHGSTRTDAASLSTASAAK